MAESTLTSKGQVTIPKLIRTRMGLEKGDRLEFELTEGGELRVRRTEARDFRRLSGILQRYSPNEPVSRDEMKQAVRRRAAAKHGGGK